MPPPIRLQINELAKIRSENAIAVSSTFDGDILPAGISRIVNNIINMASRTPWPPMLIGSDMAM